MVIKSCKCIPLPLPVDLKSAYLLASFVVRFIDHTPIPSWSESLFLKYIDNSVDTKFPLPMSAHARYECALLDEPADLKKYKSNVIITLNGCGCSVEEGVARNA